MTGIAEEFIAWACDPGLALEERYGALRAIEATQAVWRRKHNIAEAVNYQAEMLRTKARGLDPAFKPAYSRAEVERTAEVLPEVTYLSFHSSEDRPIRDISFLRFFPQVNNLSLSQSEIEDWSPLATLQALTVLHIADAVATHVGVIGELASLQRLSLFLGAPWPELAGLERLAHLVHFTYHGNLLTLPHLPALPAVRTAGFSHGRYNVPLRHAGDLPAMPELRNLKLDNTARLDGIGRFPNLLNLEIYGYFRDIQPLAGLQELTHLFLSGGDYPDVVPISRMRNLCRVTIRHEFPPDLTPLADLPRLHEIRLELTPIVPAELESLNALCAPWDDEFAADPSRPLEPLRLCVRQPGAHKKQLTTSNATPRNWAEDTQMAESEGRWFVRCLNRRLASLLGKGWKKESERFAPHGGHMQVHIYRPEDIDRLPAIVRALRELIASARYPWEVLLVVNSLGEYERDMDDIRDDDDDDEFDAEREREEWEYSHRRKLERDAFLKRKYQLRLSEELGIPPPPPDPTAPAAAPQSQETTAENDAPEYDLGTALELYASLTETSLFIHEHDRELAEMLMEMKAEDEPVDDPDDE